MTAGSVYAEHDELEKTNWKNAQTAACRAEHAKILGERPDPIAGAAGTMTGRQGNALTAAWKKAPIGHERSRKLSYLSGCPPAGERLRPLARRGEP